MAQDVVEHIQLLTGGFVNVAVCTSEDVPTRSRYQEQYLAGSICSGL